MDKTSSLDQDRLAGALMGAFIGDAMGLGPHWYYDLDEQRAEYGDWITDYADPKPHRYHGKLKAGDISQAGIILRLLSQSIIDQGEYNQNDFTARLEKEIFDHFDGQPMNGPGGYTSQSIREVWQKRTQENKPWGEIGGLADTTEAAERVITLAIRYAASPKDLVTNVYQNTALTQIDSAVLAMTTAYSAVLGLLLEGHSFDESLSETLMRRVGSGDMPFHKSTDTAPALFPSPDALLTPGYMAETAADPEIRIEPAWKVSIVYGMPCAIYHQLPAAYYLAANFQDDFESAVLHAVNGGGQNQSRAILTGALVGAQVGLAGIPARFIEGLTESSELVALSRSLAASATA